MNMLYSTITRCEVVCNHKRLPEPLDYAAARPRGLPPQTRHLTRTYMVAGPPTAESRFVCCVVELRRNGRRVSEYENENPLQEN